MLQARIITSKRQASYISLSLNSYPKCLPKPTIYCEPGSDIFSGHSNYTKIVNKHQLGLAKNWCKALLNVRDGVIICEDDGFWFDGSGRKFLKQIYKTPWLIVSAYTAYVNAHNNIGWHFWRCKYNLCGAIAIYIPKVHVRPLLEYVLRNMGTDHIVLDASIGRYALSVNLPVMLHTPTLIDHIGLISTQPDKTKDSLMRQPCYGLGVG